MRDFYGKKKDARRRIPRAEDNRQAESHRFKVGPAGLQEVGKKKKGGSNGKAKQSTGQPRREFRMITNHQIIQADIGHLSVVQSSTPNDQKVEDTDAQAGNHTIYSTRGSTLSHENTLPITRNIGRPGALDPFETLPLPASPRTKILLYHGE